MSIAVQLLLLMPNSPAADDSGGTNASVVNSSNGANALCV